MRFRLSRRRPLLAIGLVLLAALSCSEGTDAPRSVVDFIARVVPEDSDATVVLVDSALPAYSGPADFLFAQIGGPVESAESVWAFVDASDTLRRLFIGVSGMPDHYRVQYPGLRLSFGGLPVGRFFSLVYLVPAARIDADTIPVLFVASAGGPLHGQDTVLLRVVRIDPGDLVIEATWDVDADLDLRVIQPDGEVVYRGNTPAASGGQLDRDANPLCTRPGERSETVTWPTSPPPRGSYAVRLNYSHACGQASTPWTVTLKIRGQPDRTFNGTFVGPGDPTGTGVDVASFTFPP